MTSRYKLAAITLLMLASVSCIEKKIAPGGGFQAVPMFAGKHVLTMDDDTLRPVRLRLFRDTLFVSYRGLPRIDMYDTNFVRLASIDLTQPDSVYPTSFHLTDSLLIVVDHAQHVVVIYDRSGNLITSFGTLPDGVTPLSPFSVFCYGGVAYIGDATLQKVMAVSITNAGEVTEMGELILTIPNDTLHRIQFPSVVYVTYDGRLIAGDAGEGDIKVFTCDGRYIYRFDAIATEAPMAPQGIDMDNVRDPSMQDSTSFDPSGVRQMGRFHLVDANNRQVHMYNSLGKYIASYSVGDATAHPSDIAIDRRRNRIYIADPEAGAILTYEYRR